MFNLSLTACSFLLKKPYSHNKYYNLNDEIEINNNDVIEKISVQDMFVDFFSAYTNSVDDTDKKKTFHCLYNNTNTGETKTYNYIYTLITIWNIMHFINCSTCSGSSCKWCSIIDQYTIQPQHSHCTRSYHSRT